MDEEYYKFQNLPNKPENHLVANQFGDSSMIVEKYNDHKNFSMDNKSLLNFRNLNPTETDEKIQKIQFLKTQVFTLE